MSTQLGKTHLEFYRQHQIAPVRYDLNDMQAHLERRASLYLKLGLPPLAFRSARVLEVAAGTGHNSLYLAHMMPAKLVLLEPNASGIEQIHAAYRTFPKSYTPPEVVTLMLEDYQPAEDFDIVLCENWLGTTTHELSLMQKLSKMVASQGVLVVTTVSPIGFVPNLLRRFLAVYMAPLCKSFDQRTESLVQAFGAHLDTLKAMTRNHVDWIHDNMINPAYFGLCLSIPQVIEQFGERFEVIGSSPSIAEDWRWFKGLYGVHRQLNQHFLSEYWSKAHNFLDYREPITLRNAELNIELEQKAVELLQAIEAHEEAHASHCDIEACVNRVAAKLDHFIGFVPDHFNNAIRGLSEFRELIRSISDGKPLPGMIDFPGLFGRETAYLSLQRSQGK